MNFKGGSKSLGFGPWCCMSRVPIVRACSASDRGSTAHAFISEMERSGSWPCRENKNILKLVVN